MELNAYRLANWDTPLWAHANRRANRYNRPFEAPTQYFSLHPLTPWAELLRHDARKDVAEVRDLRMRVWVARIQAGSAVDINFDNAAQFDLAPADLIADDYGPCQGFALRHRANAENPPPIIVPSAALPGTTNLVVFGPRVGMSFVGEPIDEVDVPISSAAEDAHPLQTLVGLVRYEGEPHAAFEAWRAGTGFDFAPPPTPMSG